MKLMTQDIDLNLSGNLHATSATQLQSHNVHLFIELIKHFKTEFTSFSGKTNKKSFLEGCFEKYKEVVT